MKRVAIAICAGAVALGAGCGGDDTTIATTPVTTSSTAPATGATGAGVAATISADDLVTCLQNAGVDATISPNTLAGVTGGYQVVDVDDFDVAVVFATPDDTADQDTAVGLYVDRPKLAANVYYGGPNRSAEAVATCLPSG